MTRPEKDFKNALFDVLLKMDAMNNPANRAFLLRNLPAGPVAAIARNDAKLADLNAIVQAAESMGQILSTGEWALVIVAHEARIVAEGTEAQRTLDALLAGLEIRPGVAIEPIPELVIGRDARLPISFLTLGVVASLAVAKVVVPRIFGGARQYGSGSLGNGTGWMIAPDLLLTNYHVIEARDARNGEGPATEADFKAQAAVTTAWFNFLDEKQPHWEYPVKELIASDTKRDFALLRLAAEPAAIPSGEARALSSWGHLRLIPTRPALTRGDRLNIVQHPLGGPKQIAIRSNFYFDNLSTPESPERIRYLTDTEPGSSGSPVMNDDWRVVALHHAAVRVPESQYMGEVLKYTNQGIAIHAIFESLPEAVRAEIKSAQGWT